MGWWAVIVDSGCEGYKPHPPTGSTSLVHGSEVCSAFCVGAGCHEIAFMQHVTFYTGKCQHNVHIGLNVGGSFLALRKQRQILHRCSTSGGLNLTYPTVSKSSANFSYSLSFVLFGLQSWQSEHMPVHQYFCDRCCGLGLL